jgi:hypothetical protein
MIRTAFLAAALLGAAPAAAGTYLATTEVAAEARIVARNIAWSCEATACRGKTAESRPLVICQGLAKRAGRISAFSADGRGFSPAELDQCNAHAPKSGAVLAAQD